MKIDLIATGPLYVNSYIVPLCGNDVFVVDPADCLYSEDRFSVVKRLKEKNLNPVAVILTHGHFDHVSGIKDFKS
ncbi:MAG: MBL fold metallo-hydrolase, partial [Treponema sp.]|nr:MBL fold metallo-hydrolase [Treponema sp.]